MSPTLGSLTHWRKQLTEGTLTAEELVLKVCEAIEKDNPELNAYLHLNKEQALELAKTADLSKPLGGIPIAIKDNINVEGLPCTCASQFLKSFTSPYNATVVEKLLAAGAIPLGKTNLDEFAMGSQGKNSSFGKTKNPHDLERAPGGSSSGSAAAVSGHIALAALGSDTGGSIRQPASHCGIVGLKPTYGRVSRYGLVAFASSLDQIGPMTQTVEDAALLLNVMSGYDEKDSTSLAIEPPDFTTSLGKSIQGLKIGLPKEYFIEGNDPEVKKRMQEAQALFQSLGAELVSLSLPHTDALVSTYYIISCAEASSNLSRFDGVRYGERTQNPPDLFELYAQSREEGFGKEVKRRIILGTYVLSSGYYDAYYTRAQKVRTLIAQDFQKAFEQVDIILAPTTPSPAPKLDEESTPLQTYLSDIYTLAANLTGIPALSLPAGTAQKDGKELPVGIQLLAPHLQEEKLLQVAYAFEQAR